ncbi:unnamed protein product, partial [Rotaria sordida]
MNLSSYINNSFHRSSMWQNTSPNKNSNDRSSSITTIPPTTTIKTEPIDQT